MKVIFNVKQIASLLLILLITLSFPFSVSAKPEGNPGQEKREEAKAKNGKDENDASKEKEDKDERKQHQKALKDQLKQAKKLDKETRTELRKQAKETVDLLEKEGEIEEAFELQTEVVKVDLTDRLEYKKLGELYDKVRGSKETKVFVNAGHPVFDTPPVVREGRTLIPLRAVANSLRAEVDWNAEEGKVIIKRDGIVMELVIGEKMATINGEKLLFDVPASIENSRTLVPIRFISQAFQAYVDWEAETDSVIIVDKELDIE